MASPVKDMTLVPKEELAPAPQSDLATQIVSLAANKDLDVAKLQALIEMQERVMRSQAEAAFNEAFAIMQGEIPTVVERGKTDKAAYATLEDIVETVRPILTRHGFALSHRTEWPATGIVKIVGILAHRLGHQRESEFITPADSGPGRNAIQALGSAVTYGRRYTTNDLLGIVTRKMDDDGRGAGKPNDPPPANFQSWWDDLQVVARDGLPALQAAWRKSEDPLRVYVIKTNMSAWESLKVQAAKAGGVK